MDVSEFVPKPIKRRPANDHQKSLYAWEMPLEALVKEKEGRLAGRPEKVGPADWLLLLRGSTCA